MSEFEEAIERWRAVPGYVGLYEVSDWGRVKSLDRILQNRMGRYKHKGMVLAQMINSDGYKCLNLGKKGSRKQYKTHRLVLAAFVGTCPPGMEACHNNGVPSDNRLENLRWDTPQNNYADRVIHGTAGQGSKHYSAILTENEVVRIRNLYASNEFNQKELAKRFGVDNSTICQIIRGQKWKHAGGPITHSHKPRKHLKKNQVIEIRKRYNRGGITQKELAKQYGIRDSTISEIVNFKRWKHI
jgi:DNA-binding XRE family transcriptional regulator